MSHTHTPATAAQPLPTTADDLRDPLDRLLPAPAPGELFSLVDVVFPGQSNHHGTLFGGAALAMMDKFAFVLASRRLRRTVVTAALSQTHFRSPVPAGHLAEVSGRIVRTGRRSVDVEARLCAEDMLTGERTLCLTGHFVMVAVGDETESTESIPLLDAVPADVVRVVEIVFPGQVNHRGILHGGQALDWLGKAALVAATRRARKPVVMASSETLDFVAPARVGDIVETRARVSSVGRTSLCVEVTMTAETPQQAGSRLCTRASFVFVAIDEAGRPTPVGAAHQSGSAG